jgi:hypothetical protein
VHGVLIGDSHAEHFAPLIDIAGKDSGVALALRPTCMPLVGTTSVKRNFPPIPNYNQMCADLIKPISDFIRSQPELRLVVMASAWSSYPFELYRNEPNRPTWPLGIELMREGFDEFFRLFNRPGLKFLVIGEVPQLPPYSHACLIKNGMMLRRECPPTMFEGQMSAFFKDTSAVIRELPRRWSMVSSLLPSDFMCDNHHCSTVLNGEFLYRDTNHLRRNLSLDTAERLARLLRLPEALSAASKP